MTPSVRHDFITLDASGIILSGDWTIQNIGKINKETKKLKQISNNSIRSELTRLDTAGASLLHDVIIQLSAKLTDIKDLTLAQSSLLELIETNTKDENPKKDVQHHNILALNLIVLGKFSVSAWEGFLYFARFMGETTVTLGLCLAQPRRLRLISIIRHINETGLSAIPIVSLIAFLISIVLAYQGASQLHRFGADIFTIDMVAISVLREMGVLLTAIMVAGRSGSAFTAEIGVMKVNEEVDAMKIIGINPFEFLVLPRLLALMITLPLLTFIADMMALAGGSIISYSLINVGLDQYVTRIHSAVGLNDFFVGMIKAPIFAFFIAMVGCMRGLKVSGSAEDIGRQTTASVVQSIFLVLLLDALFSVLFTKLGI